MSTITTLTTPSAAITRRSHIWPAVSKGMIYGVCITLAILFIAPIVWSALTSVKPPAEALAAPATGLPTRLSAENYLKLAQYGAGLGQYAFNSIVVAVLTVIGAITLSTLGGFGFSRFSFPGKNILFLTILATLMIPFQSILTPLFLILGALKLQNTLLGLALVYITFQLPFGIFVMRNTFDTVPRELEEAALLDGCTSLSLLYRVMLSLVRPGLITVGIYAFLNSWNEFLAALIFMSRESMFTLPVMLYSVRTGFYGSIDWGALQAGVTISIVPSILLFLALQRYYMRGLMGGAIKS